MLTWDFLTVNPSGAELDRFRAKRGRLKTFQGLLPESQGQNPALTGLFVTDSFESGQRESVQRDHTLVGPLWEGHHESRKCSRVTYLESYITQYTTYTKIIGGGPAGMCDVKS